MCTCVYVWELTCAHTLGLWFIDEKIETQKDRVSWVSSCEVRTKTHIFWLFQPELSPLSNFVVYENKELQWIISKDHSSIPGLWDYVSSMAPEWTIAPITVAWLGLQIIYLEWPCSPWLMLMNGLHLESTSSPVDWLRATLMLIPGLHTLCTLSLNNNGEKIKSSG